MLPSRPSSGLPAVLRASGAWLGALLVLLVLLAGMPAGAQPAAPAAVPTLQARVTDTTGTLDAARRQALDQRLAALE
ncbi:MAG TPA: YgcG family protein, partial [Bordetella sp.]|nr:YgcG family protein [Bordetella sp.]